MGRPRDVKTQSQGVDEGSTVPSGGGITRERGEGGTTRWTSRARATERGVL